MSQLNLITYKSPEETGITDLWSEPTPALQWSHSTHSCFRRCQKQFFFGFLMANSQALHDPIRRTAWVLSQLQDLPRWRGHLVDYGIEHYVVPCLKFANLPLLARVIDQTIALARRQWTFSEQRIYAQPGLIKGKCGEDFCALFEHEYEMGIGHTELEQVEAEVTQAFRNLYAMADFLPALYGHQRYHPQYRITFPFEQGRINAVLDLLCWRGNQHIIVDWKTVENETSDHTLQMLVYAWAILHKSPHLSPDDITVYEVRLHKGNVKEHRITSERLAETENFVFESISEIDALTRGKTYKEQDIAQYEPAQTSKTCALCNYRKICLQGRPNR